MTQETRSTTVQVALSLAAAILPVLLVIGLVNWRIGPAGVASELREEHLEEGAKKDGRPEHGEEGDRRGRIRGRDRG